VVQDEVDDRRALPIRDERRVAADGRADDREDARADNDAHTHRRERDRAEGLFERVLGQLGVRDELVDGFGGEDLAGQGVPRQRGFTGL